MSRRKNVYDIYLEIINEHIAKNDQFIVTSYIRDDDPEAVKPKEDLRETIRMMNSYHVSYQENTNTYLLRQRDIIPIKSFKNDYDKSICRVRYVYICELVKFYDTFEILDEYPQYLSLDVRIKRVVENKMNIPDIVEGKILTFQVSPMSLKSWPYTSMEESFSIFYKGIQDGHILHNEVSHMSTSKPTPGYFGLTFLHYSEEQTDK